MKATINNVLILIGLAHLPLVLLGQMLPHFSELNVEHGLSSNTVYEIYHASNNLIYISTFEGLNIYDGARIQVLKNDPSNESGLTSDQVLSCCLEQSNGDIWFSTDKELARYRPTNNTVSTFRLPPGDSSKLYYILDLESDRFLWFNNGRKTYRLDTESEHLQDANLTHSFLTGEQRIGKLAYEHGSVSGFIFSDQDTSVIQYFTVPNLHESTISTSVNFDLDSIYTEEKIIKKIKRDAEKNTWALSNSALFLFESQGYKVFDFPEQLKWVYDFQTTEEEIILLDNMLQLWAFHKKRKTFTYIDDLGASQFPSTRDLVFNFEVRNQQPIICLGIEGEGLFYANLSANRNGGISTTYPNGSPAVNTIIPQGDQKLLICFNDHSKIQLNVNNLNET
ncbi:MAG: hypothetical protein AAFY91_15655, partial [Bacteroidota bacterium]